MNREVKVLLLVLAMVGACEKVEVSRPRPTTEITWFESFSKAQASAQETGDVILLSFEAPWCPWSNLMRESTYVDPAVMESLTTIRCLRVDAAKDSVLSKEFGIVTHPTVVITDAYGGELGRMIGYHSPDELLERLAAVRRTKERLSELFRQEEASSEDPRFLLAFGRLLLEVGMYDAALIRFDRAMRVDKDEQVETVEEAEYSLAECYMLSGEHKEAGRRFRIFAENYSGSRRSEHALVLAGVCYEKAGYSTIAGQIFEDYLDTFGDGVFSMFVESRLDSMRPDESDGS
jgi:thioredoxin-related protein